MQNHYMSHFIPIPAYNGTNAGKTFSKMLVGRKTYLSATLLEDSKIVFLLINELETQGAPNACVKV